MSAYFNESARLADLRRRAAARLTGAATTKGAAARATDALSVLHSLASSPETAPDALALLHELQVYQVELDLQAEELRESRAELEAALRRRTELYDFAPVGCFTIDARLVVHELNQTAAGMLGIERGEAHGVALDGFLTEDSQRRLKALVSNGVEGGQQVSDLLTLRPRGGPERPVRVHIGVDPAAHRYFVALTNAGDEQTSAPKAPS